MISRNSRSDYRIRFRRKKIIRITFVFTVLVLSSGGFLLFSGNTSTFASHDRAILELWKTGSYKEVFDRSEKELEKSPMNFFLLMAHGFSSYQLALAQINHLDMISYMDRAIWALRKAQLTKQGENDPRIKYVLGQSYFYKGPSYADLCIKYLEEAEKSYKAEDIPQFLGLAYASIRDYRSSVKAFSEALHQEEEKKETSDILLLAIARSYIELEEPDIARPYLMRIFEISRDFNTISTARLMLSDILMNAGDFKEAETQILSVLKEGGDSAEAHFELGELYYVQNDYYRARAEWRKASHLDPNFEPARARLSA
ncbi:MAG: tetratricopeptide repeat protein [Spirochaetaceae bacterium]|jgi:tetratricopeptide (TPR) repeat protein|nr:tetratricopeptide repeat protein [Spirochaetaceae bacterium]